MTHRSEPGTTLKSQLPGRVFEPGDSGYDDALAAWNLHVQHQPGLVVAAATADHIATAIRYANEADLPIGVQATGHGQGAVADKASIMISTREMTGVVVDAQSRTARIAPGAWWRAVIDKAAPYGLAPLVGSTSEVGAIGYLSGGGLPVLGRKYGYAADWVGALEVIAADGTLRRATPESEPDLFWALRGGGPNFGIVTSAEVELVPQPRFYGGGLFFPGENADRVVRRWLDWTADLPDELSTSVLLIRFPDLPDVPAPFRGRFVVHVRIAYTGSVADGERLVRPLRDLGPELDAVADLPYTGSTRSIRTPPSRCRPSRGAPCSANSMKVSSTR